jgi:YHS domain-containing protein
MLRAAVELIVTLVVMYLVRSVLSILGKAFTSSTQTNQTASNPRPASGPAGPMRPPGAFQASELKKDPVCGTFVSTATTFQKDAGGQTYFFCSADCRDKFRG